MKKKNLFLILVIVISLITGCKDRSSNNFGFKYNAERRDFGIPIVEKHWDYSFATESIILWESNANEIDFTGRHIGKIIKLRDGIRLSEEDDFYRRINDSVTQLVVVKYAFDNTTEPWSFENIINKKRRILYYGKKEEVVVDSLVDVSRQHVLSILRDWEIDFNPK